MGEVGDILKKTLAFGLGVAALTGEKLKQFADEAVQRGEMSREEAKKFVEDVSAKAEEERKSMQGWIREQVNKMLAAGGAATTERVEKLEARVEALERRLAKEPLAEPTPNKPENEPSPVETS